MTELEKSFARKVDLLRGGFSFYYSSYGLHVSDWSEKLAFLKDHGASFYRDNHVCATMYEKQILEGAIRIQKENWGDHAFFR